LIADDGSPQLSYILLYDAPTWMDVHDFLKAGNTIAISCGRERRRRDAQGAGQY